MCKHRAWLQNIKHLFLLGSNDDGEEEEETAFKEVVLNFADFEKR